MTTLQPDLGTLAKPELFEVYHSPNKVMMGAFIFGIPCAIALYLVWKTHPKKQRIIITSDEEPTIDEEPQRHEGPLSPPDPEQHSRVHVLTDVRPARNTWDTKGLPRG